MDNVLSKEVKVLSIGGLLVNELIVSILTEWFRC